MGRQATNVYEVSASGWRDSGVGAGVVCGAGAAAGQRAVRGALHRAGSAGVLRRAAPARLRRAMAGPERAAIREGGDPADPELRSGWADCGVRRSLSAPSKSRSFPGTPSESETVMRPSHSSTDPGISLSKDLWVSLLCPTRNSGSINRSVEVIGEGDGERTSGAWFFAPRKSKLAWMPPGPSTERASAGSPRARLERASPAPICSRRASKAMSRGAPSPCST